MELKFYLDENREVLTSKAPDPSIEQALDVLPVAELVKAVDDVGDGPVLLETLSFDS